MLASPECSQLLKQRSGYWQVCVCDCMVNVGSLNSRVTCKAQGWSLHSVDVRLERAKGACVLAVVIRGCAAGCFLRNSWWEVLPWLGQWRADRLGRALTFSVCGFYLLECFFFFWTGNSCRRVFFSPLNSPRIESRRCKLRLSWNHKGFEKLAVYYWHNVPQSAFGLVQNLVMVIS